MNPVAPAKLEGWLSRERLHAYAFAERVNMHRNTLSRLLRGRKRPSDDAKKRIFFATDGEITPNDWVLSEEDLTKVKTYCCGKSTPKVDKSDADK